MINKDAISLFLKKEGQELLGKHKANFWVLAAIFLLAILSIGFGSASLKYLKYKMDDPFVQWVDIIAQQGALKVGGTPLEEYLRKTDVQNQYQFKDPQPNYVLSMYFRNGNTGKDVQLEGRSIKANSAVLSKILASDNVVENRNTVPFSENELGLIITEDALEKAGYGNGKTPLFVKLSIPYDIDMCEMIGLGSGNKGYYEVAFPIVAIVKQLPGMYSFLFSDRFWNDMHANSETTWDITNEDNNQELLLCGNHKNLSIVQQQIEGMNVTTSIETFIGAWEDCECLHVVAQENDDNLAAFYNEILAQLDLKEKNITRVYNFAPIYNYYESNPSYYSIQMSSLDSIRSFQNALYDNCGIKLDMTSIDAKENFRFVQRMGNTLSICIILISVIFICVFIYFLLNTHFNKIQRNLGTFKAFGVSNKVLQRIYMSLLLMMTMASYVISLFLSYIISLSVDLITKLEGGFSWINVWVWQNGLLLVMAIVASWIVTRIVAQKKLCHTPGNLIYDRIEKEEN